MKGLSCRFKLHNGKFMLSDGVKQSRDSIWFYCIFDKFRIYCSDFGANFVSLMQKPTSYLIMNRTIILGALRKGIQKYVPNVTVNNIDIGYVATNRKEYTMLIDYSAVEENNVETRDVIFV